MTTDRVQQAKDLLIQQYREAPDFNAFLEAFTARLQEVEVADDDLLNKRGIDNAVGENLNVIGRIVVLDRPFTDPNPEEIFTFDNPSEIGGPFTDVAGTQIGGYWIGLDPIENQKFSDAQYRFILRAKIIYNTSDATIPDMHKYIGFVFDAETSIINRIGAIEISVTRPIGRQERIILDRTFPLPAGVRLAYISYSSEDNPFGFAGDERNGGFGDSTDPDVGGGFVTLVID